MKLEKKIEIDDLDRKIIKHLLVDGRMAFSDIARDLDVSPATIVGRYEKLCKSGVVKGTRVVVNRTVLDVPLLAIVGVVAEGTKENKVMEELRSYPEIIELHLPTGQFDLLCKVCTKSVEHLHRFLGELQNIRGLVRTETFIVLNTGWERDIEGLIDDA